mgnify:FL=1
MDNTRPYWQVVVSLMFSILATVAFVYFGFRAIVFLMPFVIGWIISAIASPMVNWLEKRFNIVKKLGSALIVILVIGLIVTGIYFAVSRIVIEVGDLVKNIPEMYAQLESGLRQIGGTLSGLFEKLPMGIQNGWNSFMANLDESMTGIIAKISDPAMAAAGNFAKRLPFYLISVIVAILSAYFFTIQREDVLKWMKKIAPESVEKRMTLVMDNLRYALGGYFKAQFKIMGVVFLILVVGFAVLGIRYFVLVAFLISFLDFLPFFGTGTAMIPWGIYKFLMGDYKTAIILVVLYAITQIIRQLLQPKLVGDSVGMNPLVTLLLLYVGYRLGSVFGMILSVPIGMVLINMLQAGAFDYILDDVWILVNGILKLREPPKNME